MGMDVYIDKFLILRSGQRYSLGTVDLPNHRECDLLNPELWYQKECQFLYYWAKHNLTPFNERKSDEWVLTKEKVFQLIDDCNVCLAFENNQKSTKELKKLAKERLFIEDDSYYYPKLGYYFFNDLRKVVKSIVTILGDIDSTDVEYHLIVSC